MNSYLRLLSMTVLSFISMYILMYAMVDRFANVYPNINQTYMAGLMTAPMVLIEMALMGAMYKNRTVNIAIVAASVVTLVGCWVLIRDQTAVGDRQFLRSMIPHHAGAILMCREAPIEDKRIRDLCGTIIRGQQSEIDQMNAILRDLSARS
jgi:uncharacterized protein (DUF305 family)